MNALIDLLHQPSLQRMGWVLVHFLWQGLAVASLLAAVLRLCDKSSSHFRYALICGAMLACGIAPVATWMMLARATPPAAMADALRATIAREPHVAATMSAENFHGVVPTVTPGGIRSASLRAASLERLERLLPWAVALWFAGVLALTLRLALGWMQLQRLRSFGTKPVDPAWEQRFRQLAERMRVSAPVRLVESALIEAPSLIGWLRPVILMPASVFTGLSAAQLEAILAHELAHVRRHDYLVNLLQTAVETILFYHPAVWWIGRKLREEREHCCDDIAVETMQDRAIYASALAALEEGRAFQPPFALAVLGARCSGASGGSRELIAGRARSRPPLPRCSASSPVSSRPLGSRLRPFGQGRDAFAPDQSASKKSDERNSFEERSIGGQAIGICKRDSIHAQQSLSVTFNETGHVENGFGADDAPDLTGTYKLLYKNKRFLYDVEIANSKGPTYSKVECFDGNYYQLLDRSGWTLMVSTKKFLNDVVMCEGHVLFMPFLFLQTGFKTNAFTQLSYEQLTNPGDWRNAAALIRADSNLSEVVIDGQQYLKMTKIGANVDRISRQTCSFDVYFSERFAGYPMKWDRKLPTGGGKIVTSYSIEELGFIRLETGGSIPYPKASTVKHYEHGKLADTLRTDIGRNSIWNGCR